jgi:hypothetical protein
MNQSNHQWQKLVVQARLADDPREVAAPYGFATRVAARALALPPASPWFAYERFAIRGLLVAAACGVAAIALNYAVFNSEQGDDYATTDTVGEILNLS